MALNPSGAISLAGPSAGQSIAVELGQSATAIISLNDTNVRTLAGVASGVIVMPTDFWGKSASTATQKAIFGFGRIPSASPPSARNQNITNLVSSTGVVASNTPGVGTARNNLSATTYGGDKAMFAYGSTFSVPSVNIVNLVSNTGVVASDTSTSGTAYSNRSATGYGSDKAIFAFGSTPGLSPGYTSNTNLVSNTGVVASDTPNAIAGRNSTVAARYGNDKAIIGFGYLAAPPTGGFVTVVSTTNLVSNTGVVASDTPGVGIVRNDTSAAGYGGDKAIFGFGTTGQPPATSTTSTTALVSNTGVVASDTPGVGTARVLLAAATYGGDKAIFSYSSSPLSYVTNLVSNTGVVASDTPGVGTPRSGMGAAGYSATP